MTAEDCFRRDSGYPRRELFGQRGGGPGTSSFSPIQSRATLSRRKRSDKLNTAIRNRDAHIALGGCDPMPIRPGRIVPDVLLMPALQIGNPVEALIQMVINDPARSALRLRVQ